jgi:hypothetical protein
VRQTAYLLGGDRAANVSVILRGTAEPNTRYRVDFGGRARIVTGAELLSGAIGPFTVWPRQVTPLTITRAEPAYQGQELGVRLDALVSPVDTVAGWLQAPGQLETGSSTSIPVYVTNLQSRPASGTLALSVPAGWVVGSPVSFTNLAPGKTFSAAISLTVPADAKPGAHTLRLAVTSSARHLDGTDVVQLVRPNVARGKPASQVSLAWGGLPSRAVDGNTAGDYLRDNTTSHTAEPSYQPWWQVDLGSPVSIDSIEIWNRSDCCAQRLSNYWVIVSGNAITTNSLAEALATPGAHTMHRPETAGRPTTIDLAAITGRHVRVQLESTSDPLSLTEVVVRGR